MTELEKLLEQIEGNETFGEEAGKLLRSEITKRNDEAKGYKNDFKDFMKDLKDSLGVESKDEVKEKVTTFKSSEEKLMNDLKVMKDELQKGLNELATEKEAKAQVEKDKKTLENMTAIKDVLESKKLKKDDYFIKGLMGDLHESNESGLLVGEQKEKLDEFIQRTLIDEVSTIDSTQDKVETKDSKTLITREEANKLSYDEYKERKEEIAEAKKTW